jgi:hypothetical protein
MVGMYVFCIRNCARDSSIVQLHGENGKFLSFQTSSVFISSTVSTVPFKTERGLADFAPRTWGLDARLRS